MSTVPRPGAQNLKQTISQKNYKSPKLIFAAFFLPRYKSKILIFASGVSNLLVTSKGAQVQRNADDAMRSRWHAPNQWVDAVFFRASSWALLQVQQMLRR